MMTTHEIHSSHDHVHGDCEHAAIRHDDHTDYLHDGHLHSVHGDHVDEHRLSVSAVNPDTCTTGHACEDHVVDHVHGATCGHPAVPHGDHVDYVVDGHLHNAHESHCDDHGVLVTA